jgi:Pvc16 N-terminal domain
MAGFDAIRDVSDTLRVLLDDALAAVDAVSPPKAELHDLSPPPSGKPPVLTLFLYEICEDPYLRNRSRVTTLANQEYVSRKPPLPIVLRYLVTAWPPISATVSTRTIGRSCTHGS